MVSLLHIVCASAVAGQVVLQGKPALARRCTVSKEGRGSA